KEEEVLKCDFPSVGGSVDSANIASVASNALVSNITREAYLDKMGLMEIKALENDADAIVAENFKNMYSIFGEVVNEKKSEAAANGGYIVLADGSQLSASFDNSKFNQV